jgi:hypothetical protein
MGIARRKAGTIVRCPSCASQVKVPSPETEGTAQVAQAQSAPLFERSDFDELFNPPPVRTAAEPSPLVFESEPASAPSSLPEPQLIPSPSAPAPNNVSPVSSPPPPVAPSEPVNSRPGFWVTPALATLLSVAAVVALALAFAAGLLVGIFLQPPKEQESRSGESAPVKVARP